MRELARELEPKRAEVGCFAHICAKVTGWRTVTIALLLAGLWAGAAIAAPGFEFTESDLQFDFETNGGKLPTGVASPLITDYCYKGALPIPSKAGNVFAGWKVGESNVVISNLDASIFYKYEDYAYEVRYSDVFKWRLNALWTPEKTDDPEPEQDPVHTWGAKGKSAAFPLDLTEGVRLSAGTEELTFSNLWDGDKDATVTIRQNGAAVFEGLTGEGVKTWTVDRNGRYELTHTTYTNGAPGKVETAVFVVEGKEVPVGELTIDWGQSSFVYDGQPKEPVIGVKHGEQSLTKDTDYEVSYLDNVNVGTAKAIVKGLDLYVGEVTNEFTIAAASIGPGGGEEPGSGEIPEGGLSKFDATYMYDGEGHTIKTNELVAAFGATIGNDFTVSYATGESGGLGQPALPWTAVAPVYADVGEYVVWYKVSSAKYEDFVHQVKVAITNRPMAYVSVGAIGEQIFTGLAIKPTIVVSDGEPSIITAGDYTVSYADNIQPGTAKAIVSATASGNYTGTKTVPFTIRKAAFDIDDGTGGEGGKSSKFSYSGVYDRRGHGINVKIDNPPAGMVIKYSRGQPDKAPGGTWSTVKPLYTNVCDNVVWYAVECAGYISYTNNATVAITAKPLTVTADAKEKAFGTADPALTYVANGLLGSDTLTGALAREPGEAVGTYDILQGTLAAGSNYALDFTGATFTIGQTPIIGPFEPAEPDIDPETGLVVIRLLGDQGPIVIPDNLGPFILDLNGHSITGVCGSAESGNFDGGPALTIVHVEGGEGTGLIIRNSDPEGRGGIFGGDGANGTAEHPAGGNGGSGILIEDAAVAPLVTVEENVLVRGGRGGDGYAGSGADGGNGGAGIEDRTTEPDASTIVNGGTIEGGDGGNGADGTGDTPGGNGGNGGAGVNGDVDDNTGTITGGNGGNGGDSESGKGGNGGDGGDGVSGDVGSNEGTITGGDGGDGGSSGSGDGGDGGNGGSGVGGDVGDNTGTITDGEDGTTVLTETMVSLAAGLWTYAGTAIEPTVTVTSGGSALVKDVDFAVQYLNNVNVGQATVRVTGIGSCEGTVTKTFVITPKPLAVTADAKTQVYGEAAKPFTYTTAGLIRGDTLTGALTREPGDGAGEYDILQGTLANGNYTISYTGAKYTIAKASLPGGGEEPGGGTVPEGGASKFDSVAMYDGEGHSIKTNDLVTAFKSVIGNDFVVSYAVGESGGQGLPALPPAEAGAWMAEAPAFTNVCVTSVWYKVTSANYQDFAHEAKVTVTNRPVTVTSGTKLDFTYDGKPHAYTNLTVTAGSFVAGEGIATSNWATVTAVAEGEVPNSFDYAPLIGTQLSNYALTVVTGKIAVVSPDAVVVTVTGHVASVVYDGTEKSVGGYDVVSISDPLYKVTDFKFVGQSSTNGTDAGTYPMGLRSADFKNTNPNFASVVFNVTDGKLVIARATLPGGGEEPGGGNVPEGGASKFDVTVMYDGEAHTVDTNALKAAYETAMGEGAACMYAREQDGADGWSAEAPALKDVGVTSFWYRVTSANFEGFVHEAKVTVTNRPMAYVSVEVIGEQVFTGRAIEPAVVVSDGEPSIVTASDYSVSYVENVLPGKAKAIVSAVADGNYIGSKLVEFSIRAATFAIDDGTGGEGGENSRFSYSGCYDHEGHGISVQVDNPPEGCEIKYAVGTIAEPPAEGWMDVNPLFTNVCDRAAVWYAVECEGYVSYTNKATVTIAPLFLYAEPQTHVNVEAGEIAPYKVGASVYDGYLCEWGAVFGSVQVKVSKGKVNKKNGKFEAKVTATVQLADESKKISFKGGIADEAGAVSVMTKGGHALEVSVGVNGLGGVFRHANGTTYLIDGARNVFKGKSESDKTLVKAVVERYLGVYNTAFEGGVLTFSVGKNGKTKISGTVQGAKVSLSSQLLVGDGIVAIPVVIAKKVRLALCLWLMGDGVVVAYGAGSADAGFASAIGISGEGDALRSGAWFALDEIAKVRLFATFSGLYEDYLPDGVSVSQNGTKWIVADGAKAGKLVLLDKATGALDPVKTKLTANMSGLKLTYKAKDGTFKGSFKLYNFENGKIKTYTVTVAGVMIGDRGYGTATIKKPQCTFPVMIE